VKPSTREEFRPAGRKGITLSQRSLVRHGYLDESIRFPLVVTPNAEGVNLAEWSGINRGLIERELLEHGAILFRGFGMESAVRFEQLARSLSPELLDYKERAAPRTEVGGNIYTSTEYPPDQTIPLHHEMSYSHNWPTKLWFFCQQPSEQGGRTPIADDREVFKKIDPAIKKRFMRKRVMYIRNYGEGVDLPWQEVFQTTERAVVEQYCRLAHMTCEWRGKDRLRTRAIRQVIAVHPRTGETVWFNHAHMFHVSNLQADVRAALLSQFADDELPRNAFYGDGSRIETSILDEIRLIYSQSSVRFFWQKGDVLMLDNFLASHGREPFTGPREILVAMADPFIMDNSQGLL
jgi:alpha-ketoglutarate-dependent taurine dioxygenase